MMYQVTIKGKGAMVDAFCGEGIFVTFGDNAPDTLKDFCYSIDVAPVNGEVKPGCKLVIDGKEFEIVKVGEVANENLANLGHVTYNFNGIDGECLPGTICVEKAELPALDIGSTIAIVE
ncbi:PTS glucitol/sorbitol transporter subunit IIA [Anaerostipes faecalis]|uniref:PTS glucitol/sorbitol transporter subunit IIA n=1 Tax=Anaerostipes TaxID=207244 RepID=UPI000951426D|nr:PTS glucitol/sorbitol transporter subunit IIA [Anaerostipes sp. 494a]OLR58728.1 PTS sorbitol transporter subunit IIA [Anaerostipes sp. 494a]